MDIVKIYDDYPGRTNFIFSGRDDPYLLDKNDNKLPDPESDGWFSFPDSEQGRIECKSDKDMDENSPSTYNIKKILEEQNGVLYKDSDNPNGDFQDIEITWRIKNFTAKEEYVNSGDERKRNYIQKNIFLIKFIIGSNSITWIIFEITYQNLKASRNILFFISVLFILKWKRFNIISTYKLQFFN